MTTFANKTTEIVEKAKNLFGKQVDMIVRQEQKVVELLKNVGQKLVILANNPKVQKLTAPVQIFIRMIKAHFRGDHKMEMTTLGLIVLSLVYFISPIDLIPDFLGFFGFADDLSVVLAVYAKVRDEVERFLEWERTQI
ncbi:YkvA family protein [Algoriphagus litoralis]|uniref:YkvA family protein n=1 Tax=Algoriphagus litoralis TaxID=2202829 RepID=UPI000DB91B29|nr:YkvA family protein [Algoriphagus litoralis]